MQKIDYAMIILSQVVLLNIALLHPLPLFILSRPHLAPHLCAFIHAYLPIAPENSLEYVEIPHFKMVLPSHYPKLLILLLSLHLFYRLIVYLQPEDRLYEPVLFMLLLLYLLSHLKQLHNFAL